MPNDFYRQLGTSVAGLTFGVALSIFILVVATGIVAGIAAWLLFVTSFLLMLRFWWRYNELFVQYLPSNTFWHFVFDFAASFFGILAVIFVGDIRIWSLVGALAMMSSAIRCGLSWNSASRDVKSKLRKTLYGAIGMLVIMGIVYAVAGNVSHELLAAAIFVVTLVFVVYSSRKV